MGLDLHHAIPSTKRDESFDYFLLDEFVDNPEFILRHQHLVADIEDFEHDFEILVFPDISTKEMVLKSHEHYSEKPTIIGDLNSLGQQINEIASENSLSGKEPLILRVVDNLLTKEVSREVFYHSISYETSSKIIKVLFHVDKGYQRKGMNTNFYEDFENGKLYFDKNSVLKAYTYIKPPTSDSKDELKNNFKENFIDNFIEGESIFFASW